MQESLRGCKMKKELTKKEKEMKRIERVYDNIKRRTDYSLNWNKKDFVEWYLKKNTKCFYCNTSLDNLHKFYKLTKDQNKRSKQRGNNLEVDRIKDESYSKKNCVLACYWCNNAKTDVFNKKETLEIGKIIGKIIKKRLRMIQ